MMDKVYMLVTADEYELPMIVEPCLADIARRLGIPWNTLHCAISRGYVLRNVRWNGKKCRVRRVELGLAALAGENE